MEGRNGIKSSTSSLLDAEIRLVDLNPWEMCCAAGFCLLTDLSAIILQRDHW